MSSLIEDEPGCTSSEIRIHHYGSPQNLRNLAEIDAQIASQLQVEGQARSQHGRTMNLNPHKGNHSNRGSLNRQQDCPQTGRSS